MPHLRHRPPVASTTHNNAMTTFFVMFFFLKYQASGLPAADIVVYSLGGTPPGVKFGFFSTLIVAVGFSLSLEETPLLLLFFSSPK